MQRFPYNKDYKKFGASNCNLERSKQLELVRTSTKVQNTSPPQHRRQRKPQEFNTSTKTKWLENSLGIKTLYTQNARTLQGKTIPWVSSLPKAALPSVAGHLFSYRGMPLGQVGACACFCSLAKYDTASRCHID